MEVAATAAAYKVSLCLEDLKSAIISQSTDLTAVIVTCQCCGSHVYLKSFSTTPLIENLQETAVAATSNPIYMFNRVLSVHVGVASKMSLPPDTFAKA